MRLVYPWQSSHWQHLLKRQQHRALPHALLLSGSSGSGKFEFALAFAEYLLCSNRQKDHACGQCQSCHWLSVGSHPDLLMMQPLEDSRIIKIDQIRQLSQDIVKTTQPQHYRVVVIEPAEAMNSAAANALLKNLEEPPSQVIFILVCHDRSLLPQTIQSRCQSYIFVPPAEEESRAWLLQQGISADQISKLLKLSEGLPLKALQLSQNNEANKIEKITGDLLALLEKRQTSAQLISTYSAEEPFLMISCLYHLVMDLLKLGQNLDQKHCVNLTHYQRLVALQPQIKLQSLGNLLTKIVENLQLIQRKMNLNMPLALQVLFMQWQEVV
jgi:DNA polymerase-3 subunit delta'